MEVGSGATVWSRSASSKETVANVDLSRGVVSIGASDPEAAYGSLIQNVVHQVTEDFRSYWVKLYDRLPIQHSSSRTSTFLWKSAEMRQRGPRVAARHRGGCVAPAGRANSPRSWRAYDRFEPPSLAPGARKACSVCQQPRRRFAMQAWTPSRASRTLPWVFALVVSLIASTPWTSSRALDGTWSGLDPATPAPVPRREYAAVYDDLNQRYIVFAGLAGTVV